MDVTEDLSVELNCRDRSIDGQHTAASASYDEDGQWAADKGCHTCVSRHPHRAIRWKRGEQIGMGSFGKVPRRVCVGGAGYMNCAWQGVGRS